IDLDEAQVVAGDLLRSRDPLDLPVDVCLQRVPPDRAPDREADITVDWRRGSQPLVHLRVVCATSEDYAHDSLAAPVTRLGDDRLAVRTLVDALDLPDVDLDASRLDLGDRTSHQRWPQLRVVAVGVATDARELLLDRGDEQLEEELPVVLVQPIRETLQLLELYAVRVV